MSRWPSSFGRSHVPTRVSVEPRHAAPTPLHWPVDHKCLSKLGNLVPGLVTTDVRLVQVALLFILGAHVSARMVSRYAYSTSYVTRPAHEAPKVSIRMRL